MLLKLTVLGVRGSIPYSNSRGSEYGINTSCFFLNSEEPIILDAGTGILNLNHIMQTDRYHILISHLHYDHIQGLPLFPALFDLNCTIHIYGEMRNGKTIQEQLKTAFSSPFWPVDLEHFPARIIYHDIFAGQTFWIGNSKIETVRLVHPDICTGYCITIEEKRIAYLLDCELGLTDVSSLIEFMDSCDIAIMDAMYQPGKVVRGWGHSSWDECINAAQKAGIKKILLTHFNSRSDDEELRSQEQQLNGAGIFAKEGMELFLQEDNI